MPERNATAAASPVNRSGVAAVNVAAIRRSPPKASDAIN
jgi:hypothetical protein